MRKNLQAILFLKNLSTGIIAPVLTLLALAHGATIGTVSLMIGLYSATVIIAEFPTGVFADLYGRKRSFLLSGAFTLGSYATMLASRSIVPLAAAMVLNGLGRAFSSGSIDALAIDEVKDDQALIKVTARLTILQSVGLATGALAGGALAGIGDAYTGNLAAVILITLFLTVFTLLTVQEPPRAEARPGERPRLGVHVKESLGFLKRRGTVRMLLVFTLVSGFAMLGVETYWQPALARFAPPSWMLGVVSCVGYAGIVLGGRLTERLLTRRPGAGAAALLTQKALTGVCLLGLARAGQALPFAGVYAAVYVFLGGGGVAEDTLLNREVPSARRASILSLFSFLLQLGGLAAALCGYLVTALTDFRVIWLIAGGMLLLAAAAYALLLPAIRKRRTRSVIPGKP